MEAPEPYMNARVNDLGYHNQTLIPIHKMRNNTRWKGLKEISQRASKLVAAPETTLPSKTS